MPVWRRSWTHLILPLHTGFLHMALSEPQQGSIAFCSGFVQCDLSKVSRSLRMFVWCRVRPVRATQYAGPVINWKPGRSDKIDHAACPEDGRLPDAAKGAPHIRDIFYRMGFNDQEIVALSGKVLPYSHLFSSDHNTGQGDQHTESEPRFKFDAVFKLTFHVLSRAAEALLKPLCNLPCAWYLAMQPDSGYLVQGHTLWVAAIQTEVGL